MTNKPLKVEFMPGCFDNFEGTQEELDLFQKEILNMLTNMTPEELAANSQAIFIEELSDEEHEEISDMIANSKARRTLH